MNTNRTGPRRGPVGPAGLILLAALALSPAHAEGAAASSAAGIPAAPPAITLAQAMDAAETGSAPVVSAAEALADALQARSDAAAWKGARLSVDGSWSGDLSPEATPGPAADPYSVSGSLSLPILEGLSLAASARLGGTLSGSLSWSPLAVDQGSIDAAWKLFQARTALDQARSQARLDAMSAFMDALSAEAARDSARDALARAREALSQAEASAVRGELSAVSLARSRAAVPRAQAAFNKAVAQASQAREALADAVGAGLAEALAAGAALDAEAALAIADGAWSAPASYAPGKKVLDAQAAVEKARAASALGGSGPLSLKASLSSDGSFSFGGTLSLDWSTVSGANARDRAAAIADAEDALDDAVQAERDEWEAGLLAAENARLSHEEMAAALVAAEAELAQARILFRLGESLPADLAEYESAAAAARLDLTLARLELAKARLALEP